MKAFNKGRYFIVLFLVSCILLQGCTMNDFMSSDSQKASSSKYTLTKESTIEHAEHKLGETETYDCLEITCKDYSFSKYMGGLKGLAEAESGYCYLVVKMDIKNIGTESFEFSPRSSFSSCDYTFTALYKKDYKYNTTYAEYTDFLLANESIPALGTISGVITFKVPEEVRDNESESLVLRVARNKRDDTSYIDWILR